MWVAGLDALFARVAGRFGRAEPRRQARAYLTGLLAPVERKNGWQLAEAAGDTTPDRMQRLLNKACWDPDEVGDDVRAYVAEHLGHADGVLIVDETGFVKKGGARWGAAAVLRYRRTGGKLPAWGVPGLRQPGRAGVNRPRVVPTEVVDR
jgi:SRSO17 transposase